MVKLALLRGLLIVLVPLGATHLVGQTPRPLPAAYPVSSPINFVRSWDVMRPISDGSLLSTTITPESATVTTQYADGLGRPVQLVVKQASLATGSSAVDLVTAIEYDALGREQFRYLPFAANDAGSNSSISDGLFKTNPWNQQQAFYQLEFPDEHFFYGQVQFEASPLSRVIKTLAPGDNWTGGGNGVTTTYSFNTVLDNVRVWVVSNNGYGNFGVYSSTSSYPIGELTKDITEDENKKKVVEFRDKAGRIVLKKVQIVATPGIGYTGWSSTYYVYDQAGNLRCVIQPNAVDAMLGRSSWSLTASELNEFCFRYEYDGRNRLIVKKVPGSAAVEMVYDLRDRLVLVQDGNMKSAQKWLYTQYDELNRPIVTGQIIDPLNYNNPNFHREQAAISTNAPYPNLGTYSSEELSRTFYDNYNWRSSYGNPLSAVYDNSFNSYFVSVSNSAPPFAQVPLQSNALKGLVTGQRIKILGTTQYLYSVNFYDDRSRLIQVQSTNLTGGVDLLSTQFSFRGLPIVTVEKYQKGGIVNPVTVVLGTKVTYDELWRTIKVEKNLNNSGWKTVTQMSYDRLGHVKTNKLGQKLLNSSEPLETIVSDYNIRGWLTGLNKNYLASNSISTSFFGMELLYDKDGYALNSQKQYNGNIAAVAWRSQGDGERRRYQFSYDAANRLLKADFKQLEGTNWSNSNVNFDMKIGDGIDPITAYDGNGNIKRMQQWGWKVLGSEQIDNLSYSYFSSSNKLQAVSDGSVFHGLGDFTDKNTTLTDYGYDLNGNLISDLNKRINGNTGLDQATGGAIIYNHLNLPELITVKDDNGNTKGTISYVYTALGNKLKKIILEGATSSNGNIQVTRTTTYIGNTVFESKVSVPSQSNDYTDRLSLLSFEEGRIRFEQANPNTCPPTQDRFIFDYFIKDHLGNVRLVLTEQTESLCYPAATVESAVIASEKLIYDIVDSRVVLKSGTPASTVSSFGEKIYRTHGGLSNEKCGLGVVLKVMSGDQVKVKVESFYSMPPSGQGSPISMTLSELLSSMVGSGAIISTKGNVSSASLINIGSNNTSLQTFLSQPPPANTAKAYLNWILFDDQLKYVSCGADAVAAGGGYKLHSSFINSPVNVTKSGFLYIYVSNESNLPVYFDNLQLTHTPGPILEETHYYPFGLVMSGISSKAANITPNKEQTFQEQRFDDDLGVNYIQFKYRSHDPQIGRFIQIDPLADDYRYNSTYAFSENRVTDGRELEGLEYVSIHHYSDGTIGTKMHYKSTDKEINKINGTTSGVYNSASYGPQGKGVVHYYYDNQGAISRTEWDQKQEGGQSDFAYHGLYSGPGSVTKDGGKGSTNYDFSFQPIDWSDAIAKRHDMDYAAATATGEKYAGFLEDVRTVQADRDMVQRINDYTNPFKKVEGVETPFRTSWSGEMDMSMQGQLVVIGALATYKQWKIDNGYGNKDTFETLRKDFYKYDALTAAIIDLINPNKK